MKNRLESANTYRGINEGFVTQYILKTYDVYNEKNRYVKSFSTVEWL